MSKKNKVSSCLWPRGPRNIAFTFLDTSVQREFEISMHQKFKPKAEIGKIWSPPVLRSPRCHWNQWHQIKIEGGNRMSMKTTRCQRPPKGRQRQHAGMNDEYLSNEDVYATGGGRAFSPNNQCSNWSGVADTQGKRAVRCSRQVGYFVCTSPVALFCNLLAAHARRQTVPYVFGCVRV